MAVRGVGGNRAQTISAVEIKALDISAEAILLAGGAAAILLQVANPAVAMGVARHSDFTARPLDRLTGTLQYLYVLKYGSADEARAVVRHVGQQHSRVYGDGYDARDVGLQLWVAATLHATTVQVHELVFGPLPPQLAQELLSSNAVIATALGVPADRWPATTADFDRYWVQSLRTLDVTDDARRVAREILHATSVPLWMRALLPVVRVISAGLLEPALVNAYGLDANERAYLGFIRFIRAVYPRLPAWVRNAPQRHYLARFRKQHRKQQHSTFTG